MLYEETAPVKFQLYRGHARFRAYTQCERPCSEPAAVRSVNRGVVFVARR